MSQLTTWKSDAADGGVRIELWVHPHPLDDGEYDRIVGELAEMEGHGLIDSYAVLTWDRDLRVDGPSVDRDRRARDRLAQFERWAALAGTSLTGLEGRRPVGVGRMEPTIDCRRLPRAVLAEYRDDVLVRVTPCTGGAVSLLERLAEFDRERSVERSERSRLRVGE